MESKISVLMSVYKESKEVLIPAIESIIHQSYRNIEFIIVLDNPDNDVAREILYSYKKNNKMKIIIIENEENMGLALSLNEGIKVSTGDYIARMDADDISEKDRLLEQIEFIQKNNFDLVGCNINIFSIEKNGLNRTVSFPEFHEKISKVSQIESCVAHPTWLAKKEVYKKLNGYRNIHTCEDYDFLCRAIQNGYKVGNCQYIGLNYRYNNLSISRKNETKQICSRIFIAKKFKNNEFFSLREIENYINSPEGLKQMQQIAYYYNVIKGLNISKLNKNYLETTMNIFKLIFNSGYFYTRLKEKIKYNILTAF